ncbi:hypothetical protein [Sphingomonas sp. NPDC079357]|uniref:hypothetical protein n=1 Tax=Sphingomonas sp. NPDC079357 TaxID=3364518 RepID=UPI00384BFCD4
MKKTDMPAVIQAVGLACVPVADMPASEPVLARKPVAAAVITLQARGDGHRDIIAAQVSDARDMEFPLPWLIDQALVAAAPTIITAADRVTLGVDAMARRYWAEPRLAAVCRGGNTIDPGEVFGGSLGNEAALCRRLQIPTSQVRDTEVERVWTRHTPELAMDIALGVAVSRLMLWAHGVSFASAEPDAFFETLLPLRDWMQDREAHAPSLQQAGRSRPIRRATSFASTYRDYRKARDAGDEQASWAQFEDGLFHT